MHNILRPASSADSDSDAFQLEIVLDQLHEQHRLKAATSPQIQEMERQNESLEHQIQMLCKSWAPIYDMLEVTNETVGHIEKVLEEGDVCMDYEEKKWIANCAPL